MSIRRLIKILVPLAALVAMSAVAFAYFTASGTGTATASTGSVSAAAISVPSTSTGSVTVSWTSQASAPADNSSVTYTVQRDSGSGFGDIPSGDCSGSKAFGTTSCTDTAGDGSYTYRVVAHFHTWTATSTAAGPVLVNTDTTPPTVSSINRAASSPTNAGSVSWTVTFSENVTGVDAGDFALTTSGVTGSPGVTGVTGSGTTYTVTASTGTGDGSVRLDLHDDDSIQDGAGNKLGGTGTTGAGDGSFTGQAYALDRTAPTVTVSAASSSPTRTQPLHYSISLSEAASSDLRASDVTLNAPSGNPSVTKSLTKVDATHYTLDVDNLNTTGAGDGNVSVSLGSGTFQDAAGNSNTASNTATVVWDRTAPTASVTAPATTTNSQPLNFAITLSEAPASDLQASGVSVTIPSGNPSATQQLVKTDATHYTLIVDHLATDGTGDGNVSVQVSAGAITDAVGNPNGASNTAATGWDRTAPTATVTAPATKSNTQPLNFTITLSDAPTSDLTKSGLTVSVPPGNPGATSTLTKNSSTQYTLAVSGLATTGVGDGNVGVSVNAGAFSDAAGNANTASNVASTGWDRTAPTLTSGSSGNANARMEAGDTIVLNFSEPLAPASVPATTTVTLAKSSSSATLTIPNVTQSITLNSSYVGNGAGSGGTATGTIALSNNNQQVTITLGTVTASGNGVGTCNNSCAGTVGPAGTITDQAGNGAATGTTVSISKFF